MKGTKKGEEKPCNPMKCPALRRRASTAGAFKLSRAVSGSTKSALPPTAVETGGSRLGEVMWR